MATKHTDTCLKKAKDDEPIFVLRAQDILAPGIVRMWARMCQVRATKKDGSVNPKTQAKINEAYALADKMEKWPNRKIPD